MSRDHASTGRIGEPLRLAPALAPKPWGGRRLERFGKQLPDEPIGESLESGATAVVAGGRLDGLTLGELARLQPQALLGPLGRAAAGRLGDFPLLVKLIDAAHTLSIQVHPDDAHAPAGKRGKTEAWLILDAEPGATIVSGLSGPIDLPRIESQLLREPVAPGDVFLLPAGTVHAIGAGVLLYEIQQASDVTWRLYDWGSDRELHVAEAGAVARPELRVRRIRPLALDGRRDMLVACRHFAAERWRVDGEIVLPAHAASCRVLTVIAGELSIEGLSFGSGESVVLPADLPICRAAGAAVVVVGYLPDLQMDVVAPLRAAGHAASAIGALGVDLP
jgi:mannose-6-phosphate isomerase